MKMVESDGHPNQMPTVEVVMFLPKQNAVLYHRQSGRVRLAREVITRLVRRFEDYESRWGVSQALSQELVHARESLAKEQDLLREIVGHDNLKLGLSELHWNLFHVESKTGRKNARREVNDFLRHFGLTLDFQGQIVLPSETSFDDSVDLSDDYAFDTEPVWPVH